MKPIRIDIIILSYAKNDYLRGLTNQTINTLLASENPKEIHFEVLVIESNKTLAPYRYAGTKTIYPDVNFGFNKYLNIGIDHTHNNYICLCNNDLIFHKCWASTLVSFADQFGSKNLVLSPFCETSHVNFKDLTEPVEGYFGYFAGYCFFTTRTALKKIGKLDERISFWYADMDFIELMHTKGIYSYLVPRSKVTHLISQLTSSFSKLDYLKHTVRPHIYFRYKWRDKSSILYLLRSLYYYIKYFFCWLKIKV